VQRINFDDPDVGKDEDLRVVYREELFTGEVEEFAGDARVALSTYRDGVPDGPTVEWYPDGTLRSKGSLRMGQVVGEFKDWHPNGVLAVSRTFDERTTLVEHYEWDRDGLPTLTWRFTDEDATHSAW
jgi:antitoxin component YwqK of YwqJK toxin-antitoxin module